jgi:hypothetical protein
MTRKSNTRPHPPTTPARKAGRVANTHRPAPLCNRGRAAGGVPSSAGGCGDKEKPGGWIPKEYALPDVATLERLSVPGGGRQQQQLFPEPADNSRGGRLARILGTVEGVTTADRLPPAGGVGSFRLPHHPGLRRCSFQLYTDSSSVRVT